MDKFRELSLRCGEDENNITLEALLRKQGFSRRLIVSMKRTEGGITRDGRLCRTVDRVFSGDIIRLRIPSGGETSAEPNFSVRAERIYEDEDIVIFNKPPGMAVHRSGGHFNDTLENVFAAMYPGIVFRPVNRLDRDTSGLVAAAKNRRSADMGEIKKVYFAVCTGIISEKMRIDAPIGREDGSVIKRTVRPDGKPSVTNVIPIKSFGGYTLLEVYLETGRTHQIRVHLAHTGHPLAGDSLYGGSTEHISRQALHCGEMSFSHPVSGREITVHSPLPRDIVRLVQYDRKKLTALEKLFHNYCNRTENMV